MPALRRILSLAAVLGVVAGAAEANDSVAELSTGGLVLTGTAEVQMAREDLRISPDQIAVDYVFRNITSRDITATVAFPMPDIDEEEGQSHAIPGRGANFLDFTVSQDGTRIAPALMAQAFVGQREVTDRLRAAGVPLFAMDAGVPDALAALPAATAAAWASDGVIAVLDYDDGAGMRPHRLPGWTTRSAWHWDTLFPAGADVAVAHRYTPSLGGSVGVNFIDYETRKVGGPELADYRRRYCMDQSFEAGVNRMLARRSDGAVPMESRISYVLGTGGNWAGGRIGEFTLTVDKGRPDALVSFCGTGVEKIGPTTFRMTAKDYAPPPMLEVLIVTPAAR